jgi:acyl-CoA thioester hydrolase
MSNALTLTLRVRYAECDAQQVVFNSRYAEYADLAATEYMRVLVGGYKELIKQGIDNQLVNMNISWKNPARFDDILSLKIWISKVGNSSFTLNVEVSEHGSQKPIADIEIVYVVVHATEFKKLPITDEFRHKLLAGPKVKHIDLAGLNYIEDR